MKVSSKDLKVLVARSGGRCSFAGCKELSSPDGHLGDIDFGQIAHIVSAHPGGARSNPSLSPNDRDRYENLILVCRNHHALIDSQPHYYTAELLRTMKYDHEQRVTRAITSALTETGDSESAMQSVHANRGTTSAVIFVHGLFSSSKTWKALRDLLHSDPDFAGVALLPFDYPTPKFRFNPLKVIPDFDAIAQHLDNHLQYVAREYNDIVIVSHSQGGLLVQRYLARLLNGGRAESLNRIRRVIMLACPNSGSELFLAYRKAIPLWWHPQERSLRPFNAEVQQTRAVVINRAIHARADTASEHPLSVAVYAGLEDGIVRKESALDVFPDDSTRVVRGDHFTIIQPRNHRDPNYLTVKNDLLGGRPPTGSATASQPIRVSDSAVLTEWGWSDD